VLYQRGGYLLLPPEDFLPTGPVDHADWNYRFLLGWISRQRLKLAGKLLPPKIDRLLKIGYGSGVHLPHWATKCRELYGIDPHRDAQRVTATLAKHNVTAQLTSGTAESMPYPDHHFDCLLAISSIEFIPDLVWACQEMHRVLQPSGKLVIVTPGRSPVVDLGLRILTGESAKNDYGDRRAKVVPTLQNQFEIEKVATFPILVNKIVCLYSAMRLRPKATPQPSDRT
jgi:ubiquinone/menaquinone biosynthesis C-methylase UbiE